jgi:hypothetical protein
MKIYRISGIFKERCPHCNHENEIHVESGSLVMCDNCGGGWETTLISKKFDDTPSVFIDSPVPMGYDRRIRSSSYKLIKVAGAEDKIRRFNITDQLCRQVVHLDEQFKLIDWNALESQVKEDQHRKGDHTLFVSYLKDRVRTFKIIKSFQGIAKEKLEKRIQKSRGATKERLMQDLEALEDWDGITNSRDHIFQYSSPFMYIVITCLQGLRPNNAALETFFNDRKSSEPTSKNNLIRQYNDIVVALEKDIDVNDIDLSFLEGYTGWIYIPGLKQAAPIKYDEDVRNIDPELERYSLREHLLNRISQGTGWCTGEGMEKTYLPEGSFWKYLENGKAKLSIREEAINKQFYGAETDRDEIAEMQGLFNSNKNAYPYLDKFYQLDKKYPKLGGKGLLNDSSGDMNYGLNGRGIKNVHEEQRRLSRWSDNEVVAHLKSYPNPLEILSFLSKERILKLQDNEVFMRAMKDGVKRDSSDAVFIHNIIKNDLFNILPKLRNDPDVYGYIQSNLLFTAPLSVSSIWNGKSNEIFKTLDSYFDGQLSKDGYHFVKYKSINDRAGEGEFAGKMPEEAVNRFARNCALKIRRELDEYGRGARTCQNLINEYNKIIGESVIEVPEFKETMRTHIPLMLKRINVKRLGAILESVGIDIGSEEYRDAIHEASLYFLTKGRISEMMLLFNHFGRPTLDMDKVPAEFVAEIILRSTKALEEDNEYLFWANDGILSLALKGPNARFSHIKKFMKEQFEGLVKSNPHLENDVRRYLHKYDITYGEAPEVVPQEQQTEQTTEIESSKKFKVIKLASVN